MSSQRHQQHLSSYLKSRKSSPAKDPTSTRGGAESTKPNTDKRIPRVRNQKTLPTTHKQRTRITTQKLSKNADNINRLPDEVLFKVFRLLSLSDLLICAQVCTRWSSLVKDRSLWQDIFTKLPQEIRKLFSFEETKVENFDWKREVIKRCVQARNSKFGVSKKKMNPYTGLQADVQNILKTLSISWKMCFTDTRGQDHWITANESTYFDSSVSVRWLSFQLPPLAQLSRFRIFAAVPVFFDKAWKPHKRSAMTHSLLLSHDFKAKGNSLSRDKADAEGDMITAHFVHHELLVACWTASWKDGGEIAFVTACLHYNTLLKRILLGSLTSMYQPPSHKPILDDIDSHYGLHGYSAMVELRNHKSSYWSHQFRDVNYSDVTSDFVVFRDFPNGTFSKKLTLPWKTELFRNTLQNACFLDFTVLDEHKKPLWCTSCPVKVRTNSNPNVDYSAEGECLHVEYSDEKGTVHLDLVWNSTEEQTRVSSVEFLLRKSLLNAWFGRSY